MGRVCHSIWPSLLWAEMSRNCFIGYWSTFTNSYLLGVYTGSVRGSPNGIIGNFTNGTIGSQWYHWLTNGTIGTNFTIGRAYGTEQNRTEYFFIVEYRELINMVPLALPLVQILLPLVLLVKP